MDTPITIVDRLLDIGIVTSNEALDLCCPDCVQNMNGNNVSIYVLASVETFLKFAEAFGCGGSSVVPAIPNSTEQPLGSSSYDGNCQCCTHIYASVETELKLYEFYGYQDEPNTSPPCSDNFNDCVNNIFSTFTAEEMDRILDKGIVEYGAIRGSSQLCKINEYLDLAIFSGVSLITKAEIIDRILDKGFVVSCHNDEMIIASVETWLKSAETRHWTMSAAVPTLSNKE
jgi:hypothetical protein